MQSLAVSQFYVLLIVVAASPCPKETVGRPPSHPQGIVTLAFPSFALTLKRGLIIHRFQEWERIRRNPQILVRFSRPLSTVCWPHKMESLRCYPRILCLHWWAGIWITVEKGSRQLVDLPQNCLVQLHLPPGLSVGSIAKAPLLGNSAFTTVPTTVWSSVSHSQHNHHIMDAHITSVYPWIPKWIQKQNGR